VALDKRRTLLTMHDCASLERLSGWRRTVLLWSCGIGVGYL
jgi:hypothetical protein